MPKNPIDYSKTVIYGIFSNSGDGNVYIGHTTNFISRKREHKNTCNNPNGRNYNLKVYKTIRENGGWNNFTMRLIEEFPCNTRNEAAEREFYYFQQYNATMNTAIPNRSNKQWFIDNKEKCIENSKVYYNNNKEKFRDWSKNNKDKKSENNRKYRTANIIKIKESKKIYSENNKDKISEKNRKYYTANINKIKESNKIYCSNNRDKLNAYHRKYYASKKKSPDNVISQIIEYINTADSKAEN